MQGHVCTNMLLNLMMNFNLMKKIIFLCFHEHKNSKLSQFTPIFKRANFRVLQFNDSKNDSHVTECSVRSYAGTDPKFRTSCSRNMTANLRAKCF